MDLNQRMAATESTLITISGSEPKEKRVLLKVQGRNGPADEFWYWICRKARFQFLMADYTQRVGVKLNSVRFLYDGSPINPKFTANDMNIEDGDIVDVIATVAATQSTLVSLPRQEDENPIFIQVDFMGCRYFYCLGRNTPLHNLMLDFCDRERRAFPYEKMRFIYRGRQILNPHQTADVLEMQNEDIIVATYHLCGC